MIAVRDPKIDGQDGDLSGSEKAGQPIARARHEDCKATA